MRALAGDAARRLQSNPGAVCALAAILCMVVLAIIGLFFSPNGI